MRFAYPQMLWLLAATLPLLTWFFACDAFLQCPLTLDEQAFRQSLEALEVGIIPQGGTALTAAIETALTAFKSEGDNYKILVLFTDGEDHERDAIQAAKQAAKAG